MRFSRVENLVYFRKGKETKVISKLRENFNEAHYVRTTLLRKNREIGLGRILSCARILKGPSEFLKTRVIIDPRDILLHLVQKKEKRYSSKCVARKFSTTRQDFSVVFSQKIDKLVDSFESVSIGRRIWRKELFDKGSIVVLALLVYSPFFPKKSIRHRRCTYVTASFVIHTQRKITLSY